jgi:hypothetical protein
MRKQKIMRSLAIERVLGRRDKRAGIGSLNDLRQAYQSELATHRAEIEAQADKVMAMSRESACVPRHAGVALDEAVLHFNGEIGGEAGFIRLRSVYRITARSSSVIIGILLAFALSRSAPRHSMLRVAIANFTFSFFSRP